MRMSQTNHELEQRIDTLTDRVIFLEGAVTAMREATLGIGEPHPMPGPGESGVHVDELLRKPLHDKNSELVQTAHRALVDTTCGHCSFDEAEGALLNHCDACCRKIVTILWAAFEEGKL